MTFTIVTLTKQVAAGEDSRRQFKAKIANADSLVAEMAAFANTNGGVIFIGVQDNGTNSGLKPQEVHAANQLIMLPYHGIGSGILRALESWPDIDFEANKESLLFKAIVFRPQLTAPATTQDK